MIVGVLYRGERGRCPGCPFKGGPNDCSRPGPEAVQGHWNDGRQRTPNGLADCGRRDVGQFAPLVWSPVELAAVASGLVPYVLREDADPTPAGLSGEGENNGND